MSPAPAEAEGGIRAATSDVAKWALAAFALGALSILAGAEASVWAPAALVVAQSGPARRRMVALAGAEFLLRAVAALLTGEGLFAPLAFALAVAASVALAARIGHARTPFEAVRDGAILAGGPALLFACAGLASDLNPWTAGLAALCAIVAFGPAVRDRNGWRAAPRLWVASVVAGASAAGTFPLVDGLFIGAALGAFSLCAIVLAARRFPDGIVPAAGVGFGLVCLLTPDGGVALQISGIAVAGAALPLLAALKADGIARALAQDTIARRTKRLRYLLNERDEVTALAVHDLQSPIKAVTGIQRTVLHILDAPDVDKDAVRKALQSAAETCEELSRRVESVLSDERRRFSVPGAPQPIGAILTEVIANHRVAFDARQVCVAFDARQLGVAFDARQVGVGFDARPVRVAFDARKVRVGFDARKVRVGFDARKVRVAQTETALVMDGEEVRDILDVFVDNAARHAPPKSTVTITVAPHEEGRIAISVSDEGSGVEDHLVPHLFAPKPQQSGARNGIGLHLAERRARAIAGALHYQRNAAGGATFTLNLPSPSQALPDRVP
ncbi:MAG: ATP-binding protein [Pseudomonadota bacterium]